MTALDFAKQSLSDAYNTYPNLPQDEFRELCSAYLQVLDVTNSGEQPVESE